MAVITVSKIQVRSGLTEDLPALDTGEFGWCVDSQRLFIGKGTLQEGAPITGVTEILTEYSAGAIGVSIAALSANIANLNSFVSNIASIVGNLEPATVSLLDNQSSIANIGNVSIASLTGQIINYNISRNTAVRTGVIKVSNYLGTTIQYEDNYSETSATGVSLYFTGNTVTNVAVLGYTTTSTGFTGNFTYSYTAL